MAFLSSSLLVFSSLVCLLLLLFSAPAKAQVCIGSNSVPCPRGIWGAGGCMLATDKCFNGYSCPKSMPNFCPNPSNNGGLCMTNLSTCCHGRVCANYQLCCPLGCKSGSRC